VNANLVDYWKMKEAFAPRPSTQNMMGKTMERMPGVIVGKSPEHCVAEKWKVHLPQ
jgi:hypothetical protein